MHFSRSTILWLLFGIILGTGIFLRSFSFSEWLRFNDDQARDAAIVSAMFTSDTLPLLGPKAGGTGFYLGPAFYYIESASVFLFGNTPEALAYPVLIASIVFLVLYFLVAQKLFSPHVALATTAVLAVSFFHIKYSRFAWNPNLTPLFSLLFLVSLERLLTLRNLAPWYWVLLLGLSFGIGVQLHSTLLFLMPVLSFGSLLIAWRCNIPLKKLLLAMGAALILNAPILFSEIQHGGENTAAFWRGLHTKTSKDDSLPEKIRHAGTCLIQGSTTIVSTLSFNDDCDLLAKKYQKSPWFWPRVIGEAIFFFGGILLMWLAAQQEADTAKRTRLFLLLAALAIFSLFLIPLGGEAPLRFLVVIIFIPFLLLGFWLDFLFTRNTQLGRLVLVLLLPTLCFLNLSIYYRVYPDQERTVIRDYFGGQRLGNIQPIAAAIAEDIRKDEDLAGQYWIVGWEASRGLHYLVQQEGIPNINFTSFDTLWENRGISPITAAYIAKPDGKTIEKNYTRNLAAFSVESERKVKNYTLLKIRPLP